MQERPGYAQSTKDLTVSKDGADAIHRCQVNQHHRLASTDFSVRAPAVYLRNFNKSRRGGDRFPVQPLAAANVGEGFVYSFSHVLHGRVLRTALLVLVPGLAPICLKLQKSAPAGRRLPSPAP